MIEHHFRPYSVRLFVPDGDPNSFKIIQKTNWTGVSLEISRDSWEVHQDRSEFNQAGVYILSGQDGESGLPMLYIGRGDVIKESIDSDDKSKMFWDRAAVFVSGNDGLDRKHITWIQWMLIQNIHETGGCQLDNDITVTEPALSEYEKADAQEFLYQILNMLPIVNIRLFDRAEKAEIQRPKALEKSEKVIENTEVVQETKSVKDSESVQDSKVVPGTEDDQDTIIIPTEEDAFKNIFLEENSWYPIEIDEKRVEKIKYLGAYQTAPVSAITYCAEIKSVEAYNGSGMYKLNFKYRAQRINPIELGDAEASSLQKPGYTNLKALLNAKTIKDLFQK
ncbi:MAG: GIY-YIG nuclease family protein [Roseivirga sp.]|nr:GIY-YIG nuclease family protein [Roseivirga sp.]